MDCGTELASLVAADCENPAIAGLNGKVRLLPYNGIDRPGSTITDNVISEIVMLSGKKGFVFDSFDNSPVGSVTINAGTYQNTLNHGMVLRIFVKSEAAKDFVNKFLNARVVIITDAKEEGADGSIKYETWGWHSGLVLTDIAHTTEYTDGVVFELTTGSDETSKEKTVPKSVWAGSLTETEQMLNSLTA